jgi:hypothetical protein
MLMPTSSRTVFSVCRCQASNRLDEIFAQSAANAAVGQLDQLFLGALQIARSGDQGGVDVHLTHIVDDHRDPPALPVGQNVVEQGCFPCSEEPGQHGDGKQVMAL